MTTPQSPTPAASGVGAPLSARLRPNIECAPWVIEAVKKLEALAAQPAPVVGGDDLHAIHIALRSVPMVDQDDVWHAAQDAMSRLRTFLSTRPAESVAQGGEVDYTDIANRAQDSLGRGVNPSTAKAIIKAYLSTTPTPTPATGSGGEALHLPEDGAYLIRYDDHDEADELFAYSGARENAFRRYRDRSSNWNAHLYVKIDSNSRDCEVPSAKAHPAPAGGDAGDSR